MNAQVRDGEFHGHPLFEERQAFAAWVYVVLAVVSSASVIAPIVAVALAKGEGKPEVFAVIPGVVLINALVLNLMRLRTRVTSDEVVVGLGTIFPMIRKRIRLRDIVDVRAVHYRPLLDAGGWGMRFGRFEGKGTTFWNARGDRGVLIVTARRPYVIGSQLPEDLCAVIRVAMSDAQSPGSA